MNNILQVQENALLSFSKAIQPGRPTGLFIYFSGTNDTGKTGALSSLGTLIVKRNGRTIVNRRVESLARIADIRFGSNLFSSTEAQTFTATVPIPFFEEGLPQSLNIQGDSELVVSYEPGSGTIADFASLNATVYTMEGYQTVPEYYEYQILGDDQSISGAVDKPYQLNDDNISAVYLEDPDSAVSNVGFKNNNGQVQSSQPWNVLEGMTLLLNRLETSTFDMVELQLFSEAEPFSYFNRKNIIEIETSQAGTVKITKCILTPNARFMSDLIGQ